MLCNFTETNLQNYFKQPNKKNRFIFQNIFILQFYFLKIRMFFRLNRKTLIYHFTNTTRRRLFYPFIKRLGLIDKIQAKKLHKPLFYLPLQAFEKMNKKSAFTVVVK